MNKKKYVVLHNIRSTHNVGSIFRTCDGARVEKIYICGYTPAPIDRFGRKRNDVAKVSLGAEESVKWESSENTLDVIWSLKKKGILVVGVEQDSTSRVYNEVEINSDVAFVFGSETEGLSQEIIKECDMVLEIPLYGKKESLNVSVAVGIILFNFL